MDVEFIPSVIDRYPDCDYKDSPWSPTLPLFAFPNGLFVTSEPLSPALHEFALTTADGTTLYCCGLIFYEPLRLERIRNVVIRNPSMYAPSSLTEPNQCPHLFAPLDDDRFSFIRGERGPIRLFVPKCMTFVSHYDFSNVDQFPRFLSVLYKIGVSATLPFTAPIESLIRVFVREIPVPPRGRMKVVVPSLGRSEAPIVLSRSPPNELPPISGLRTIFEHLDVPSILTVFGAILLESKVVFLHEDTTILSRVTKSFIRVLFPFHWPHVFIPVLPHTISGFLNAPLPFIIGIPTKKIIRGNHKRKWRSGRWRRSDWFFVYLWRIRRRGRLRCRSPERKSHRADLQAVWNGSSASPFSACETSQSFAEVRSYLFRIYFSFHICVFV